jgi:hypothetical protein
MLQNTLVRRVCRAEKTRRAVEGTGGAQTDGIRRP